jgi:GAF domain-containing protein
VCGEGVEELDDLRTLAGLDVTYAQGYALARPGPDWPRSAPEAARAVASDVVAGMRLAPVARTASGAFSRALGDLADEIAAVDAVDRIAAANVHAAALLGADDVALLHLRDGTLRLLSEHPKYGTGDTWHLDDFPATKQVIAARVPAQVVAGDPLGDRAELDGLEAIGMGTLLMLPVVFAGRDLAVMEVYRVRAQAFTAAEIDRARVVAQQFGAALDRLLA